PRASPGRAPPAAGGTSPSGASAPLRSQRVAEVLGELGGLGGGVVAGADRFTAMLGHALELGGGRAHDVEDGVGDGRARASGDEPAVLAGSDELGNAGDVGRQNGAAEREGFHDDHGEALGEARENEGATSEELRANLGAAAPAGDAHALANPELLGGALDVGAELAVADEDELGVGTPADRVGEGLDEEQVPLL